MTDNKTGIEESHDAEKLLEYEVAAKLSLQTSSFCMTAARGLMEASMALTAAANSPTAARGGDIVKIAIDAFAKAIGLFSLTAGMPNDEDFAKFCLTARREFLERLEAARKAHTPIDKNTETLGGLQ